MNGFQDMTGTEYEFRQKLHHALYGHAASEGDLERPLIVQPFDGNYGQAGVVLAINGSPPRAIVLVIGKTVYLCRTDSNKRMQMIEKGWAGYPTAKHWYPLVRSLWALLAERGYDNDTA